MRVPGRERLLESLRRRRLALKQAIKEFTDELVFRARLCWRVASGRLPIEAERRPWDVRADRPVLIDVYDWTNNELVFSVLVWPPLDKDLRNQIAARRALDLRVAHVKDTVLRGAASRKWSMFIETDYGLEWNTARRAWVDSDGHAYEGWHAS